MSRRSHWSTLTRMPELKSSDMRRVNGLRRELMECQSWSELSKRFIGEVRRCFSVENFAWNEFQPDYSGFSRGRSLQITKTGHSNSKML